MPCRERKFQSSGQLRLKPARDFSRTDCGPSGRMADTLHEFATNWDVHKKKLLSELEALQSAAEKGAKAWNGLDSDLAKALLDAGKKEG